MIPKKIKNANGEEQYEIIKVVKSGGFGTVYTAMDLFNNRTVAVKITEIFDKEYSDVILREAAIASELDNENIVKTICYGKDEKNNFIYIVMEYIKNGSLDEFLSQQKTILPLHECINIFKDILNGLAYAHKKIIHRDLKPSNILIDEGKFKICDFGLAKYIQDTTKTFSYKGAGTYSYMSPEAWTGEENTEIMDIYSMGLIFYEILSLEKAFVASTPFEYKDLHLFEQIPNISLKRKDIPIKLKEMIIKMTNKRRIQRYKNVEEIIAGIYLVEQQMKETNTTADGLANRAQMLINEKNRIKMEKEKKENEEREFKKRINFAINEIILKIEEIVTATNERLENGKISLRKYLNSEELYELVVEFMGKTIKMKIFGINDVQEYSRERKEKERQFQINEYEMILNPPQNTVFEIEKIILVGIVEIENKFSPYSLNLLLKEDNEYGEWHYSIFNDTWITRNEKKQNYGLTRDEFYEEFPKSRVSMHTKEVKTARLEDKEIENWLNLMMM